MIYLQLFWEFFKTGLLSIGGGLVTLPFLFSMSESHPEWFTAAQLGNMVAVSESTPGPIGINMATYAGFNAGGIIGSIVATGALVLPSIVIILIIARAYEKYRTSVLVQDSFHIIRPVSTGMIFCALFTLASITLFDQMHIQLIPSALFVVFFILCMSFKKVHPVVWIALGAVSGMALL
ncbi:MAG: chromate transporter [Sphaerochaetaceae bacterium]|jgi:chromate transporter|nr:chromate transporter [Sphaerochaetaceae bacterium]MDD3163009.1 chromate transporter [Sphaerochaetaceae bacterium]MDD4007269.1 chromate transporter [Sphaerochaetaceae bacterium]MDD4396199.1 chromate transporter [Sphaerochaetaceae bacterium]